MMGEVAMSFSRAEIKAMRPAEAFVTLQGLREKLRTIGLDAEAYDTTLGLLEEQLVRGTVVDARDVMAIAQEVLHGQRNDGAMVNPELVPALIAGLSALTNTQPLAGV
ncbi:hypothetical protein J2847_006444 [Azospirillum agricola]|uniref:hypothetical protein n=1 Tax=Azospirillum agricola TaxID=1720247 RepID=UPI001AE81709|nr:hypothetical protein [Azospirillum agricola]MBP2233109.1 hypothetical protein [Azospirillum agricola]